MLFSPNLHYVILITVFKYVFLGKFYKNKRQFDLHDIFLPAGIGWRESLLSVHQQLWWPDLLPGD